MRPLDGAELDGLARHREVLESLAGDAEALLAAVAYDDAAGYVETAANFAWRNHTGLHASVRLEGVIDALAAEALDVPPWEPVPAPDGRERVLHVLTEGYDTGGHTRVARRWIERDGSRLHWLALTGRQPSCPSWLPAAVHDQGGSCALLDQGGSGIVERARALRTLAAAFHRVVLHVNPFDAVAALAFRAHPARPPVVMKNHADHVFWLGHGSYDALACYREGGVRIARERRGAAPERTTIVRLPLDLAADERPSREAARQSLGIPADARVVLTIGSPYKYLPVGGPTLAEPLARAIADRDDAILVVVGPRPTDEPWASVARRLPGAMVVTGPVPDISTVCAAADVYVEAYPCAGTTTLVDVGAVGLPVVAFCPDRVEAELLGTGHPDIPDARVLARDTDELRASIVSLLDDPAEAARRGAELRSEIEGRHGGPAWSTSLERTYELAAELSSDRAETGAEVAARATPDPSGREDAILYRLMTAGSEWSAADLDRHARALALARRCPALRARFEPCLSGHRPSPPAPYPVAVAAPAIDRDEIAEAVDALRALDAAGFALRFVVTVPPACVNEAVPLIEEALTAGADVDIDLVPAADPQEVLQRDWLAVASADAEWPGSHALVHRLTAQPAAA